MVQRRLYATQLGAETLRKPATGKGRYTTRMLQAGDAMLVDGPRARLLTKMGWADEKKPRKAKAAEAPAPAPPPPPPPQLKQLDHDGDGKAGGSTKQAGDEVAALRAEYQTRLGRKPFNGWDVDTLRAKIAEAPSNG